MQQKTYESPQRLGFPPQNPQIQTKITKVKDRKPTVKELGLKSARENARGMGRWADATALAQRGGSMAGDWGPI